MEIICATSKEQGSEDERNHFGNPGKRNELKTCLMGAADEH
jgi:hypothetical protein